MFFSVLFFLHNPAAADWVKLSETKRGKSFFVQSNEISVQGDSRVVVELIDNKKPDRDGDRSVRVVREYDCKGLRYKVINASYYKSPMAEAFFRMYDAVFKRKVVESPRQWCKNVLASDKTPDVWKRFAEMSLERMPVEGAHQGKGDGKEWARQIVRAHEAGEVWEGTGKAVNFSQLQTARMALGNSGEKAEAVE